MNNVLYQKTIVNFQDSEDGETATVLYLTEENNGYIIWVVGSSGREFIEWHNFVNPAIEAAVKIAEKRIAAYKEYHEVTK